MLVVVVEMTTLEVSPLEIYSQRLQPKVTLSGSGQRNVLLSSASNLACLTSVFLPAALL